MKTKRIIIYRRAPPQNNGMIHRLQKCKTTVRAAGGTTSSIQVLEKPSTFRPHTETLSVVAMRVCNPDRSPVGINR
jgi:hypothetical protein